MDSLEEDKVDVNLANLIFYGYNWILNNGICLFACILTDQHVSPYSLNVLPFTSICFVMFLHFFSYCLPFNVQYHSQDMPTIPAQHMPVPIVLLLIVDL